MNRTARRRNAATSRTEPVTKTTEEPKPADDASTLIDDKLSPEVVQQMQDAEALRSNPQRSLLAQLRDWLATVPDDHPYNDLPRLAREAGWDWLLRQAGVQSGEKVITVTFDVLIGRIGMDAWTFQPVDQATFALPAVPGPVSVAARAQINETIIYMIFGRLPPRRQETVQPSAMAPERTVEMGDEDVSLDDDEPVNEPTQMNGRDDDIEPMVTGADVPAWEPGVGLPDVVVERVNGVPVFADLDDVQAPSSDVIVAVTNEINAALVKMTTVDQVRALWDKNKDVFDPEEGWLTQMATFEQRQAIAKAFKRRRGQIEAGFGGVVPGRRQAVN